MAKVQSFKMSVVKANTDKKKFKKFKADSMRKFTVFLSKSENQGSEIKLAK